MKSLIFLDDERSFNDVFWIDYQQDFVVIETYRDAKSFIQVIEKLDNIKDYAFSFDHDIQSYDENGDELTGYSCAKALCNLILERHFEPSDLNYFVHSQNPIGKLNIERYIQNFIQHCGN